jgi:predicted DNA-binding protein with PD1-like motif
MEILGHHKAKEIISVRVDPGECLVGTIERAVKEVGGNAIVLTAVGSLIKVVLSNPKSTDKQHLKIDRKELDGPFEIVSLVGAVGPAHKHGETMSHMHIAVSRHDKPVGGGGLGYGSEAWFPVEVHLLMYE